MLFFNLSIKISSQNKKQLKKFLIVLKSFNRKSKINLKISSFSNILLKKKNFSVLKSPHVHKTAQEQFYLKSHIISLQFLNLLQLEKLLLFLKFFNSIFFDFTLKLQVELFFKLFLNFKKQLLNTFIPNNFLVTNYKSLVKFVELFNTLGELKLLTYFKI
nr:ribosomal protein S10 [Actinocyclus sp. mgcode 4]